MKGSVLWLVECGRMSILDTVKLSNTAMMTPGSVRSSSIFLRGDDLSTFINSRFNLLVTQLWYKLQRRDEENRRSENKLAENQSLGWVIKFLVSFLL